jgi:hypothetical protein
MWPFGRRLNVYDNVVLGKAWVQPAGTICLHKHLMAQQRQTERPESDEALHPILATLVDRSANT